MIKLTPEELELLIQLAWKRDENSLTKLLKIIRGANR